MCLSSFLLSYFSDSHIMTCFYSSSQGRLVLVIAAYSVFSLRRDIRCRCPSCFGKYRSFMPRSCALSTRAFVDPHFCFQSHPSHVQLTTLPFSQHHFSHCTARYYICSSVEPKHSQRQRTENSVTLLSI